MVAESFERGVKASDVTRRHDVSPQQLFRWRRQARSGALVDPVADDFSFAGVRIESACERLEPVSEGVGLELIVGGATVPRARALAIKPVPALPEADRDVPALRLAQAQGMGIDSPLRCENGGAGA